MYNKEELEKYNNSLVTSFVQSSKKVLVKFSEDVINHVKNTTAFGGNKLRNQVRVEKQDQKISTIMDGKVAMIMNDGSEAHVIRARKKKFLFFEGSNGPVFAKQVNHPGTKKTEFFDKANEESAEKIPDNLNQEIEKVL